MDASSAVTGSTSLQTNDISVEFDGLRALSQIELDLRPGEILGLIGPNGAGKTTLVNVITGFQKPSHGTVSLAGTDITGVAPSRRGKMGIARTFQGARLFAHLTVEENIEVGVLVRNRLRRSARKPTQEILDKLGLTPYAHRLAGSLPFGVERRIGIARAMAMQPDFLLLDEPAAGLNEEESDDLAELIRGIRESDSCGVLVIEHDMRLVMSICDRLHVLNYGQTLAVGDPQAVRNDEEVIRAYLGSAE